MSSPLLTRPVAASRPAAPAPSLLRLVAVELAKVRTTRAPAALVLAAVLVGYAAVLVGEGTPDERIGTATIPVALLLAVAGATLVTTEWHHRTAQSTFLLVPRRGRVLAAKYGAATVLGALAAVAFLVPSVLLAGGAATAGPDALVVVLGAVIGVGIGAAVPSTAGAMGVLIGGVVAVSASYQVLGELSYAANLVVGQATAVGLDTGVPTRVAVTALVLWIAVPGALGAARLRRDLP